MASRDIYKFAVGLFQGSPGTVHAAYLADILNGGASVDDLYASAAGWSAFTGQDFDFSSASTNTQFATQFVANLTGNTLSTANFAFAVGLVEDLVESNMAAGETQTAARGLAMKVAIDALDAVAESDENFGTAAARFHNQIDVAVHATEVLNDSATSIAELQSRLKLVTENDGSVAGVMNANMHTLFPGETFSYPSGATAGLDVMRLTGDQSVRIDFTNAAQQIRALDLDNDGVFDQDGVENQLWPSTAPGFEIVDAYRRDYVVERNIGLNFLGDIHFDGTSYVGFEGDGVGTDGNIFLGGLGVDRAFGGVGNDFMAGGGVAVGRFVLETNALGALVVRDTLTGLIVPGAGADYLSGGRNADFFFVELSALDPTDGGALAIDAGVTSDNNSAGNNQSPQDADWLLFEGSDDDEPVEIVLNDHLSAGTGGFVGGVFHATGVGTVTTRSGVAAAMLDVENVDASGNFYGFLNNVDTVLGGRGVLESQGFIAPRGTNPNTGIGSTAQLDITGSIAANRLIGGYDNDVIDGAAGNDLLMGGNLNFRTTNPALANIVNDGRDELFGGAGNDDIVFEVDGGVIDGGADNDTLWLTANSLGTRTAAQTFTDGRLRIDLLAQNLDAAAGYGGADSGTHDLVANDTQDQSNYITGANRVALTNMENVIATGLGNIDYDPDGTNTGELNHTTQMNFGAYGANDLDLRGSDGANRLYASAGDDVLEGRGGNDSLSGGLGDDDFIFQLGAVAGDGVDIIHRQADATGDGFWDGHNAATGAGGSFGRDFNDISAPILSNSKLTLTLNDTANPAQQLAGFPVNGIVFTLAGVNYTVTAGHADTYAGFTTLLNTALDANAVLAPLNAVLNADNTITITDPAGGTFVAGGFTWVDNITPPSGTLQWNMTIGDPAVAQTRDRIIYQAYEDRADGEKVDDNSVTGSAISLGVDSYAQDLVINFAAADYDTSGDGVANADTAGTNIAEDQVWQLNFANLTTEDKVKITVNGVIYELQVGVDLDGNSIAAEDGVGGDTQGGIQHAFLIRLRDFINSFMDDDTAVGALVAATSDNDVLAPDDPAFGPGNDRITLTQRAYAGEETVYMRRPIVDITDNSSGGQVAASSVVNASQHDVHLLDFDGRNGELNANNVLFWGNSGVSRAILATAPNSGGTLAGSEAVVIDGGLNDLFDDPVPAGTVSSFNNTATNATLALNFSVHGDDLLIGGTGIDNINAGTGDDRVHGSLGNDVIDGGKNYYAVQVLGEARARVYVLNVWEAANPGQVAALAGLTISTITLLPQTQSGLGVQSGLFDDTLLFQQQDFLPNTNFTITLLPGTTAANVVAGVLQMPNGGAGTVAVDNGGDNTIDATTTFTNFENIRTVSGTGHAVAGDGQGNDTLNVTALSTALGGVLVNITNDVAVSAAGDVRYSVNAHASLVKPAEADFETLIIKVDGVENVVGGLGDDLVLLDETEAAKNNTLTLGLGDDRVIYRNDYNTLATADLNGDALINALDDAIAEDFSEPTVMIRVDDGRALGAATPVFTPFTHQVVMTSGRVGATVATDTLVGTGVAGSGSEWVSLEGNTGQGRLENDVIDVTAMAGGAVVDYVLGQVRDLAGVIQLRIDNMFELENVWADGNDTVIVADAAVMGGNARSDIVPFVGTAPDIALATWLNYDVLNGTARVAFLNQTPAQIVNASNQNQFTFDMSRVGVDVDTDRVDYSNANDQISLRVELDPLNPNQFVLVDADGVAGPMVLTDSAPGGGAAAVGAAVGDRVDRLISTEQVVASQGESILDLTASTKGLEVNYQPLDLANQVAGLDRDQYFVQISDLASSVPLTRSYVEYRDAGLNGAVIQPLATWSRVEGSDFAERVILNSSHSTDNNTFNLRGGANEVKYNELTRSITTTLQVSDFDAANPLVADASGFVGPLYASTNPAALTIQRGTVMAVTQFQDGSSPPLPGAPVPLAGGGTHVATSYTANNGIAGGSLKIAASQDAEDTLAIAGLTDKLFLLSEVGTTDNQITVKLGSGAAQNSIILTGYERLLDAASNDVYQMGNLLTTLVGLALIDTAGDHDTVKVGNDAIGFNGSGAGTIDLDNISATVGGFNMDFDGLDITAVTVAALTVNGGTDAAPADADVDATDELVVGALNLVTAINDFESIVITGATTAGGSVFVLDTTANTLTQGATVVAVDAGLRTMSAGGLVFEGELGNSYLANVATPVTFTALGGGAVALYGGDGNDTLTGATGDDTVSGGAGNDTLAGGGPQVVNLISKQLVAFPTAAGGFDITVDAVVVYTTVAGDGTDVVGTAVVNFFNANPAATWGGVVPADVTYAGGTISVSYNQQVGVAAVDAAFVSNDAGIVEQNAAEITAFAAVGAGADVFRGGSGVDVITAGAGADAILVAGTWAAGQYAAGAQGGLITVLSNAELTAAKTVSDVAAGDAVDGGDGFDTLVTFGTTDYTILANLPAQGIANVEALDIHSTVIMTLAQLQSLTVVLFNGLGPHIIEITGDNGVPLDPAAQQAALQTVPLIVFINGATDFQIGTGEDAVTITEEDAGDLGYPVGALVLTATEVAALTLGDIIGLALAGVAELDIEPEDAVTLSFEQLTVLLAAGIQFADDDSITILGQFTPAVDYTDFDPVAIGGDGTVILNDVDDAASLDIADVGVIVGQGNRFHASDAVKVMDEFTPATNYDVFAQATIGGDGSAVLDDGDNAAALDIADVDVIAGQGTRFHASDHLTVLDQFIAAANYANFAQSVIGGTGNAVLDDADNVASIDYADADVIAADGTMAFHSSDAVTIALTGVAEVDNAVANYTQASIGGASITFDETGNTVALNASQAASLTTTNRSFVGADVITLTDTGIALNGFTFAASGNDILSVTGAGAGPAANNLAGLTGFSTVNLAVTGTGLVTIANGAGIVINEVSASAVNNVQLGTGGQTYNALAGGPGVNVAGGSGNDSLFGSGADDTFTGGAGDDRLMGGAGSDIALFAGSYTGYAITSFLVVDLFGFNWTYQVEDTDTTNGSLGTDLLQGVDEIRFADLSIFTDSRLNPPILADDALETDEDTLLSVPLSQIRANDEDFDRLKLGALGLGGTVLLDTTGTIGSVSIDSSGGTELLIYDPGSLFQYLAAGESVTDTFNYTVDDGSGGTDSAAVEVTVTGKNDLETAVADDLGALSPDVFEATTDLRGNFTGIALEYVIPLADLLANDTGDASEIQNGPQLYSFSNPQFRFDNPGGDGPVSNYWGGTSEIVGDDVVVSYTFDELRNLASGPVNGLFTYGYVNVTVFDNGLILTTYSSADVSFDGGLNIVNYSDDASFPVAAAAENGTDGEDGSAGWESSNGPAGVPGVDGASWLYQMAGSGGSDVIFAPDAPNAGNGGNGGDGGAGANAWALPGGAIVPGADGGTGGTGGDGGDSIVTVAGGQGDDIIFGGNAGNGGVRGDTGATGPDGESQTGVFGIAVPGGSGAAGGAGGQGGDAYYSIDGGLGNDTIFGGRVGESEPNHVGVTSAPEYGISSYLILGGEGNDDIFIGDRGHTILFRYHPGSGVGRGDMSGPLSEYLVGGEGGDDTFHLTDYLYRGLAVSGGSGFDRLILHDVNAAGNDVLDFTNGGYGYNIDGSGGGTISNFEPVREMFAGLNQITVKPVGSLFTIVLNGAVIDAITDANQLYVNGDEGMRVNVTDDADWVKSPSTVSGPDDDIYDEYINSVTGSTLYIETGFDLL